MRKDEFSERDADREYLLRENCRRAEMSRSPHAAFLFLPRVNEGN
jgi:hypothetical protein